MERGRELLRPRNLALAGVIGAIALYEYYCPQEETISEALDPILSSKYGWAIEAGLWITTAHITNRLAREVDPFEQGLSRIRQRGIRARE